MTRDERLDLALWLFEVSGSQKTSQPEKFKKLGCDVLQKLSDDLERILQEQRRADG